MVLGSILYRGPHHVDVTTRFNPLVSSDQVVKRSSNLRSSRGISAAYEHCENEKGNNKEKMSSKNNLFIKKEIKKINAYFHTRLL